MEKLQITKPKGWVVKDRAYILKGDKEPLIFTIPIKHSQRRPLTWFDKEVGYQRELRYATNQPSIFVDEQKGEAVMGHVVFRNGFLNVPAKNQALQMLLSEYHPYKELSIYTEKDEEARADNELDYMEIELSALNLAHKLEIDHSEALLRVEQGSIVSKLSSREIKRDVLLMAKRNPKLFIELANDENVELRNLGIKAVEAGILKLSPDNRVFTLGTTDRKVMTVPFDEHPYSALAVWFKTDEGLEMIKSIEKKIKSIK